MPKVSVLMPVYKTDEEYLKEAIESILQQTFTDFEFLILDDCPDDNRENVIKSYQDSRIKYKKNDKNLGISSSRNKLIQMASGEYLAIFDHDDVSLPHRLEKQVAYLDTHPDVGVVSSWINEFPKHRILSYPQNDDDIKLALVKHCVVAHSASMIRKSVLTENHIKYEEIFTPSEDYGLWCRLIGVTKFYNIPEVLFYYRKHANNTSKLQQHKMNLATIRIHTVMEEQYPALCKEYQYKSVETTRINLFGVLPLLLITQVSNKINVYLFNKILFLKIKTQSKLSQW